MQDDQVSFKLVGAPTYNTLVQGFIKGTTYVADRAMWETEFKDEKHPVTGTAMFAEVGAEDLGESTLDDATAAGLAFMGEAIVVGGEQDTGIVGSDVDLSGTPDGADLSDLDEDETLTEGGESTGTEGADATGAPEGAEGVPDADATAATPEGAEASQEASKAPAKPAEAPKSQRKLSVGGGKRG